MIRRIGWRAMAGAILAITMCIPVRADSLWSKGEQSGRPGLFADARARTVGDLVTIIIVEKAEALASASTGSSRGGTVDMGPGQGLLQVLPLIQGGGTSAFEGDGRSSRKGSIQAQMTARVTQVLQNGCFVIEGRQTLVIDNEEQEIVLTGMVRPEDISADNTVLSTYVADARIAVRGEGSLGAQQKPGLLTRIFGWVF